MPPHFLATLLNKEVISSSLHTYKPLTVEFISCGMLALGAILTTKTGTVVFWTHKVCVWECVQNHHSFFFRHYSMWCIEHGYITKAAFAGCPTSKELVPALNHSISYTNQTVVNRLNDLLCTEMRVEGREVRRGEGEEMNRGRRGEGEEMNRGRRRGEEGGKEGGGGREKDRKERTREGKRKGRSHKPVMVFYQQLLPLAGPIRHLSTGRRGSTKCMNWRERAMVTTVRELKWSDLYCLKMVKCFKDINTVKQAP